MKAKLFFLFFCLAISLLFASEQVTAETTTNDFNAATRFSTDQSKIARNNENGDDNTAPTITLPDSFTFSEDGSLVVDFSPYVDDADGDKLYLELVNRFSSSFPWFRN